jgi:glycosyltransferase involved in cell wall biosynthesis
VLLNPYFYKQGGNAMKNEVSLCMIVKNEEEYLPKCLESIKDIVDEMVIVDTGSTDKTVEIAKEYSAKVHFYKWNNNFSEARNESLKHATKDWILILDADDEVQQEYKDNLKLLLSHQLDENAVYYFETLNFTGDVIDDNCITINLNPRMFKNKGGIHYEGEIHNQLYYPHKMYDAICSDVKIHHYGYMNKSIKDKDKRNRNISILNELIQKEPDNKFNYFNLGSEYTASGDMKKALEYYYIAYEDFNPNTGFSPILLLRIVISNYTIKEYTKALEFIDITLKYYPKFTDAYFFKALIYKELGKPTLQIKALNQCIEIGESSQLKYLYGSGSFKAYFELGSVYMSLNDYDTAYNYFAKAIKSKPNFSPPLYCIAQILEKKNTALDESKTALEKLFIDPLKSYPILADIFYREGFFKISLEYVQKCEEAYIATDYNTMLRAKCLIRTGAFSECIDINNLKPDFSFYLHISMYRVLSFILSNDIDKAEAVLSEFKEEDLLNPNKKLFKVYIQLVKLFRNKPTEMLSDEVDDKEYRIMILEILEILLINKKFDELKTAVNLLNLIDNRHALLSLGKLYYNYDYIDIAKTEILRSIKEFDIYDNESLDILKV